jgi:hypothetical protein
MAWPLVPYNPPPRDLPQRIDDAVARMIRDVDLAITVSTLADAAGFLMTDAECFEFAGTWLWKNIANAVNSGRVNERATEEQRRATIAATTQDLVNSEQRRLYGPPAAWPARRALDARQMYNAASIGPDTVFRVTPPPTPKKATKQPRAVFPAAVKRAYFAED